MRAALLFVEGDDDFLEQGAQQFLFVARCGGRGLPDLEQIGAECEQAAALVGRENKGRRAENKRWTQITLGPTVREMNLIPRIIAG